MKILIPIKNYVTPVLETVKYCSHRSAQYVRYLLNKRIELLYNHFHLDFIEAAGQDRSFDAILFKTLHKKTSFVYLNCSSLDKLSSDCDNFCGTFILC